MILFAPENSRQFAEAVARSLDVSLGDHEERDFEDGEHKIRPLVRVRDEDVYVIASLYGDDRMSVNDKFCRLLFFVGAIRDAGASRLTAVIPYLCYARKDRKTKSRDPLTTRYVAQLLEAVGVDRVVTMDVHNLAAFQNAFRIPTVHLEAASVFVNHLLSQSLASGITIVSPDAGGVKRAIRLRDVLQERLQGNIPLAMMEKKRSEGVVSGEIFAGDVKDRLSIVIDDLISTGTTLARAATACCERGAAMVQAAATHGLFIGNAAQVLKEKNLAQVIVTNTVPPFRLKGQAVEEKLVVLDVAPLFAQAIRELHEGGSVEEGSLVE